MSNEVKANRVATWDDLKNPGDFIFTHDKQDRICGLVEICPCGCGAEGGISFVGPTYGTREESQGRPLWDWNGSQDKPTITPSIQRTGGCRWHGYLTDGVFRPA